MPANKDTSKKSAPSRSGRSGELKGADLDKVTGGVKAGPVKKSGDPCDGGN
jgi:hypothetical protein